MPATLLRQTCQVAGLYAGTPEQFLVANFGQGVTQGNRVVFCQGIFGPGAGKNDVVMGPTQVPIGAPVHPTGGGNDVGYDQTAPFAASADILWFDVTATEAGSTQVTFRVNDIGVNHGACWAGEYEQIDTSDYGFFDGIDGSLAWNGAAQAIALNRTGGNTCNYTPELSVWMVVFGSGATVSGANYTQQGYATDGANVGIAVQDGYFNAVGVYNAAWTLGASSNYIGANLTMKTLVFPTPASVRPSGIAIARSRIHTDIASQRPMRPRWARH